MPVETIPGTRDFGHRLANCEINFTKALARIAGISEDDAFKVLTLYRKNKLVKLDTCNQTYRVTHGGFLDANAIRRALAMAA